MGKSGYRAWLHWNRDERWHEMVASHWCMFDSLWEEGWDQADRRECLSEIALLETHKRYVSSLDGRNRAIVITESLAWVIAAIRITSAHWRSYLPLKTQNLVLVDPAFVVLRFESRDWAIGVRWCSIRSTWNCGMASCTFRTCTLFFVTSLHCLTLLVAHDCPL